MFTAEHQRLTELDPSGLSRPELVDAIERLHCLESHAAERRLTFTSAIAELGDNGADAATVTRNHARRSPKAAQSEARAATALKRMPAFSEALRQGQISTEHLGAMADAAERVSPAAAEALVEEAVALPADLFAKRARKWINQHESADTIEDEHQRRVAAREGNWSTSHDGMTHFHVTVPTASAKLAIAALDERVDKLWRQDGGRDGSPNDVRSPAQRRADAFVWLLANRAVPGSGKPHPKFMAIVHLDLATGMAEYSDGEPVAPSVLAEIAGENHLEVELVALLYGSKGQALYLSRSVRLASRAQWIALIDRDRGCVRCNADPSRTHAHHVKEFSAGGETDLSNLELDCHSDHTLIHQHEFDPRRRKRRAA